MRQSDYSLHRQLHLLKEVVPRVSRIAVLMNPTNPMTSRFLPNISEVGQQLGVTLVVVEASEPDQLESALCSSARAECRSNPKETPIPPSLAAQWVPACAGTTKYGAARYQFQAMYLFHRNVRDGGLISYGPDKTDNFRRAGAYVDKILRGDKPGDLPVEQPTRFQLVVNLKTANTLGVTVPPSILARADEVIE